MLLYPTLDACNKNVSMLERKRQLGLVLNVLSREEATFIEPALNAYPDEIGAVIYSPNDAVGRPDQFCAELLNLLKRDYGLHVRFNTQAQSLLKRQGKVHAVMFRDAEPIYCDHVVIATGQSSRLLPLKDRLYGDMWPVQGYSFTTTADVSPLNVSITDVKRKLVFAPLGQSLRVAGLADIGKQTFRFDPARCQTLIESASSAFPLFMTQDTDSSRVVWSGARYVTPSSQPIIRKASMEGVYLNMGHGTLGWTLCLGAAERLINVMRT